jgi:acyl dehydratase
MEAGMPFLRPISDRYFEDYVEGDVHYLTKVASLGSPGGDELRWVRPVRPGDILSVRVTVLKAVSSKSKPDRGAVTSFVEVINQASEVVMTFKVVNIIAKRPPES